MLKRLINRTAGVLTSLASSPGGEEVRLLVLYYLPLAFCTLVKRALLPGRDLGDLASQLSMKRPDNNPYSEMAGCSNWQYHWTQQPRGSTWWLPSPSLPVGLSISTVVERIRLFVQTSATDQPLERTSTVTKPLLCLGVNIS